MVVVVRRGGVEAKMKKKKLGRVPISKMKR